MTPLFWNNNDNINYVENVLRDGGVILAEGDTVLGLLADISAQGHAQLDRIKNRENKPYLVLVENKKKALNFVEQVSDLSFQIEKIMNVCWPGPATLLLKAKTGIPACVTSAQGTVAIRVPDHAGLLKLLSHFEGLFSTSANLAGEPVPARLTDVDQRIMQSVAGVILNDDLVRSAVPSTIIDCTGQKIKIVREGAFSIEKLVQFF
jgi:L-threonylcarbamoyladenylate synthase